MLEFKVKMLEHPLEVTEVPGVAQAPLCFQVIHECSHGCAIVAVTGGIKAQLGTVTCKLNHCVSTGALAAVAGAPYAWWGSQPSVTPVPGHLVPFPDL